MVRMENFQAAWVNWSMAQCHVIIYQFPWSKRCQPKKNKLWDIINFTFSILKTVGEYTQAPKWINYTKRFLQNAKHCPK